MKFDRSKSSFLQIDVQLNKEETCMLTELLFDRTVDDHYSYESMSSLSIYLEWTKISEEKSPSKIIVYFNNHLILWTDDAYVYVSYVRISLESTDKIESDI